MKSFRLTLSVATLAALAAGYLGSQYFALNGQAPEWAKAVDTPVVAWAALAVLLAAVGLALIPDRGDLER